MDGFRLDIGATFLSMVQIAEEMFEESGKKLSDYVDLVELDPMYQLVFPHVSIDMSRNQTKMVHQIEKIFLGNGDGYLRFMKEQKNRIDALMPVLQNKFDSFFHYINPQFAQALPQLNVTKNIDEVLSQYFDDEYLTKRRFNMNTLSEAYDTCEEMIKEHSKTDVLSCFFYAT
ncbi:phytoene desaturase family protein [Massilibacterium senegalense]|uniref:phytoene desaturase family protein n=1 Tax=Massilibacterium senegalense TaxID=1632858 RepID=UPI000785C673|nr:hypothetical protein [Massilibacterium senegalense]